MLKPAIMYKDELNFMYNSIALEAKFKYYICNSYVDFNLKIEESTWNRIQCASVDKNDNVIGYFSASVDRGDDVVSELGVMNFNEMNYTFSKDFHNFLDDLFTKYNFRKICFTVVVGNPAEKMYDKYIEKYNGRVVGVKKQHIKLQDQNYYDYKYYEIFRDDYLKVKESK